LFAHPVVEALTILKIAITQEQHALVEERENAGHVVYKMQGLSSRLLLLLLLMMMMMTILW